MAKFYLGTEQVSENEFYSIMGTEEIRPYISKVYCNEMSIEEVPENIRESVATAVEKRKAKWGKYEDREIDERTLKTMLEGVL